MLTDLLPAVGGLGLFLFGMIALTEGLKGLAGGALRRVLTRFTKSPVSGAATGALTTALVQSSSATTVAAVGFVGAGLLTFSQALGIVFGANIGTTITGWLVAIVGFKLDLGTALLPGVLVGALMRLFGRGRVADGGTALAGFALLFVGIDAMQAGLAGFEGAVTPADFPPDTLAGRVQLVLLGILITLVTQSSSAGVATAMVALGAGAVTLPQAAALVIGMDVGTTFTAALATVGGSTPMRRTGLAHVVYNLLTGAMAFALLTPFAWAVAAGWVGNAAEDPQIALVAFHTGFNALGVVLVLFVAGPFARLVERLVPERGPPLTRRLDERLLADPAAATDAAFATVRELARQSALRLRTMLAPAGGEERAPGAGETEAGIEAADLAQLDEAQAATRAYVERIATTPRDGAAHARHLDAIHALDHLARLSMRCRQEMRLRTVLGDEELSQKAAALSAALAGIWEGALDGGAKPRPAPPRGGEEGPPPSEQSARLDGVRKGFRDDRRAYRRRLIAVASGEDLSAEDALKKLDAMRWLHRVSYHLWRIVHHLDG